MESNTHNDKLIEQAKSGAPKVRSLKQLLSKGANINYQTAEIGYTSLMFAVKGQHDRIVECLLRQGADPLIKNHENKMASELINQNHTIYLTLKDYELLFAVLHNDLLTAEAIIAAGALVNIKGTGGYTALMIAVEQNFVEMVEFLLLQGADPTLTLAKGESICNLTTNPTVLQLLEQAIRLSRSIESTPKKYLHRFFTNAVINNY